MSTISSLPKEILDKIVKDLENNELLRCQSLCREWYHIFHLQFLKSIHLYGADNINEFIESIDSNPDPTYLNAVTAMTVDMGDVQEYSDYDEDLREWFGDKRVFQHLFFRFPNLKDVFFHGDMWILGNLNDELCRTFLKRCPKLDKFEAYYHEENYYPEEYYSNIDGARLLITLFDIRTIDTIHYHFPSIVSYVTSSLVLGGY